MKKCPSAIQLKNLIKDSLKSDDEEQSSPVPSLTPSFCTKVEEGSTVASCRHHRAKTIYISDFIIHEEAELQMQMSQSIEPYRSESYIEETIPRSVRTQENSEDNRQIHYLPDTHQLLVECRGYGKGGDDFVEYMIQELGRAIDKFKQKETIKRKIKGVLNDVCVTKSH